MKLNSGFLCASFLVLLYYYIHSEKDISPKSYYHLDPEIQRQYDWRWEHSYHYAGRGLLQCYEFIAPQSWRMSFGLRNRVRTRKLERKK